VHPDFSTRRRKWATRLEILVVFGNGTYYTVDGDTFIVEILD